MAGSTGLEPAASGVTGASPSRVNTRDFAIFRSNFVGATRHGTHQADTGRYRSAGESGTPTGTVLDCYRSLLVADDTCPGNRAPADSLVPLRGYDPPKEKVNSTRTRTATGSPSFVPALNSHRFTALTASLSNRLGTDAQKSRLLKSNLRIGGTLP